MIARLEYFTSKFAKFGSFFNLFGPKKSYLDLWTNLVESFGLFKSLLKKVNLGFAILHLHIDRQQISENWRSAEPFFARYLILSGKLDF